MASTFTSASTTAASDVAEGRITISSNCPHTSVVSNSSQRWIIHSPSFPEHYPALSSCRWTIATDPGYQVTNSAYHERKYNLNS